MQTPNISKLLEGNKCRHCGRKDAEGEGAADQPMYNPDLEAQLRSRSPPGEFDLLDKPPEVPVAVQQEAGEVEGEALEEVLGEEDTSQAEQSLADEGEVGIGMEAVEEMDVGEEGTQAGTLDGLVAGIEVTREENLRLSQEMDALREELSRADKLSKDLQTSLGVAQEELEKRDQYFDEPRNNLVIGLRKISQVRKTAQSLHKTAEALPISRKWLLFKRNGPGRVSIIDTYVVLLGGSSLVETTCER
jgi:hypothetical protein